MKKYLFLLITATSFNSIQAQDVSDAMRYSQDNLTGTARFRAMGGAFGALGGDFSSLNVNPAGGAIFTSNQVSVSLSNLSTKNKSNYFGTRNDEKENAFDLNQLGAIWVFNNTNEEGNWRKFTVGVNYDNTNNYDNKSFSQGFNPNNSVSKYFLSHANGTSLNTISNNPFGALNFSQQQAYFGYNGFLINPNEDTGNNVAYNSNTPNGGNYYQENTFRSTGYNGKLSFNFATQYKDKFYFGLNLNSHFTDYTSQTSFYEDYLDTPGSSNTAGVQALRFNNELYTYGSGFSFQVGTIAKITNELRVGLSYESPTWYRLTDETYQNLSVDCVDCLNERDILLEPTTYNTIYSSYTLRTPGKYTASLAYVFGKLGLISIDYAMKDYSNTKFSNPDNNDYLRNSNLSATNNDLNSLLYTTSEIRVGAEARAKQWSFRGGYRFEQSPYKNGNTIGDLHGISGGVGYNFGGTRIDAAYSYSKRDMQQAFFSQGFTDTSNIQSINNNVTLTLLFDL